MDGYGRIGASIFRTYQGSTSSSPSATQQVQHCAPLTQGDLPPHLALVEGSQQTQCSWCDHPHQCVATLKNAQRKPIVHSYIFHNNYFGMGNGQCVECWWSMRKSSFCVRKQLRVVRSSFFSLELLASCWYSPITDQAKRKYTQNHGLSVSSSFKASIVSFKL